MQSSRQAEFFAFLHRTRSFQFHGCARNSQWSAGLRMDDLPALQPWECVTQALTKAEGTSWKASLIDASSSFIPSVILWLI